MGNERLPRKVGDPVKGAKILAHLFRYLLLVVWMGIALALNTWWPQNIVAASIALLFVLVSARGCVTVIDKIMTTLEKDSKGPEHG